MWSSMSVQRNKGLNTQRGFTLVELIVSVGLFAIVMTVSIGTLLIVIDANRRAQSLNAAMTNVSFAVDSMTRNIRTGYDYFCATAGSLGGSGTDLPLGAVEGGSNADCVSGDTAFVFTNQRTNERTAYQFTEIGGNGVIQQKVEDGGWFTITASDVDIDSASSFTVRGAGTPGDVNQPQATIIIAGEVLNKLSDSTTFILQSNAAQRVLDF